MVDLSRQPYVGTSLCEDCGEPFRVQRLGPPRASHPGPKFCPGCRPKHTGFGKGGRACVKKRGKE